MPLLVMLLSWQRPAHLFLIAVVAAQEKFRRNDILALLVAMLGPPPLPTKFFVLVAGVVGIAVKLGDRAAETLREHYLSIAGALAAAVVLYFLLRRFVQRGPKNEEARERPSHRDADIASVKPPEAPESDSSGIR
jgi:hypothetical protein